MRTKSQSARASLLVIYAMLFAMQCGRGVYFVVVTWFALHMTGELASIGLVLIWQNLLGLVLGPFMGVVVDRFRRRTLFIVGESLRMAGIAWLGLNILLGPVNGTEMPVLYSAACMVALGALLSVPAIQGLIQSTACRPLTRVVAIGVSVDEIGTVVGAISGGVAMAFVGIAGSLGACMLLSVVAIGTALQLRADHTADRPACELSYPAAAAAGFRVMLSDRRLLAVCIAIALAWSCVQMTNALLAVFTRFELELGAESYGWLSAMFGIGAIVGGSAFALMFRPSLERLSLRFGLLFLAVTTAGFSMAHGLWQALFLHALMGVAFVLTRAVCDAYVLHAVAGHMIGRVRSNIQAMIGVTGLLVYLSPNLYSNAPVRAVYLGFAGFLASAALVIMIWQWRPTPALRASCAPQEPGAGITSETPIASRSSYGVRVTNDGERIVT